MINGIINEIKDINELKLLLSSPKKLKTALAIKTKSGSNYTIRLKSDGTLWLIGVSESNCVAFEGLIEKLSSPIAIDSSLQLGFFRKNIYGEVYAERGNLTNLSTNKVVSAELFVI